jgi:hypothetical protein
MNSPPEEIPCIINGKEVFTGVIEEDVMPTNHAKVIAKFHVGEYSTLAHSHRAQLKRHWP